MPLRIRTQSPIVDVAAMEIRRLQHFLAVAETLNYGRAAKLLTMSTSPLSRSIRLLEAELGGPVFERGTRTVALTSLGAALVPYARRVVGEVQALERAMREQVEGRLEVRVGVRSITPQMVRAIIGVITTARPGASVQIVPLESFAQLTELQNGRLAFGLVNRVVPDAGVAYLPVLRERAAMALPDREPYATLSEVHPEHVSELSFLVPPGFEPFSPHIAAYRDAAAQVVHVENGIVGGLSALIATGDACCLSTANREAPWYRHLAADGVVIRPLPAEFAQGTTHLAWLTARETYRDLGPILDAARRRFVTPLEL
jgi:DNA-binding transcriptional LysR family regulator